jgi:hypothetical protein
MEDMIDILSTLRDTGTDPADAETVASDVARGRRALTGRRSRRVAGFAAVAAAAVLAVGTANQFGHSGQSVAIQQTSQVQLAAYDGPQPAGFTVDTVPAGWKVTSSTKTEFLAVPPGTKTKSELLAAPARRSTSWPDEAHSLMDGIAVMLQGKSRLPSDSPVTKVTINGKEGQLGLTKDKTADWLIFPEDAGHSVLVQVPTRLGMTTSQIIRFAKGVTVSSKAHSMGG